MRKLDQTIQRIIVKSINNQFDVNDLNQVFDKETTNVLYPNELSEFIEISFDIDKDTSDHIVFGWLLEKDFKDIRANWELLVNFQGYYDTNTVLGGPNGQISFNYDDTLTVTGGTLTNSIVLGNNNTVTTSDTTVIGNDNTVTFITGSSYTYSIDTATDNSNGVIIQMNPDGTHEYVIH